MDSEIFDEDAEKEDGIQFVEEPDLPSRLDYDSRKTELHQIFESAFKY